MSDTHATSKKIIISAGGTGGHLFPALALAQALQGAAELLFVGGGLATNPYFDRESFHFKEIPCGSFVSKKPWRLAKALWNIFRGIRHSIALFRHLRPDVVVGFGSFYSFPPLVAARLLRIPIVLYAADAIPGRVVRLVAPYAHVTGTHFAPTAALLKGISTPVGMPLRETLRADRKSAAEARNYFGLDPQTPTLLIFGGSQGAQRLNELILEGLEDLACQVTRPWQVLHFTGNEDAVIATRTKYEKQGVRACVKGFEARMGLAWSAASLVVCRSGAGTIAEIQQFEVPAVLVPYPYATDAHQDHNADILVACQGAIKLSQPTLEASVLAAQLARLLNDDGGGLTHMHQALALAQQNVVKQTLAGLVWETLKNTKAS